MSGMEFSKWLNNEYILQNPEKSWIKDVSTKSTKQSIMNAHTAFKKFFMNQSAFPKFKKKNRSNAKMYFVKNDAKHVIKCERHRINIPTLGWVQIKEKGYFPTNTIIKSGSVSMKAGRYYVSVLVDIPNITQQTLCNSGIGVDLGIKEFITVSNGTSKENINKTKNVKKTENRLKREQRKLSRKYESLKKQNRKQERKATRQNIQKQIVKVQKIHQRLNNIRTNHVNQTVNELVKTKPSYITIEDLNVSGMMKNRHLAKSVANQRFYEFRKKLINKCKQQGIELRIVDRYYPSSKLCHNCGNKNKDLKLSDRVFICKCGYEADRDYNASLNLRDAKIYKIA
jgi:putative transposase